MQLVRTPNVSLVLSSRDPIDAARGFADTATILEVLTYFTRALAMSHRLYGGTAYAAKFRLPLENPMWPALVKWLGQSWENYQWANLFLHALHNQRKRQPRSMPSRYEPVAAYLHAVPANLCRGGLLTAPLALAAGPFSFRITPKPLVKPIRSLRR